MDLFGPVNIMSIAKKKYCLVIVDDFTRFTWTFFLHSKDEASQIIINHIKVVDNGTKWRVKKIRSDNGTEFKNSTMKNFCDEKGITHTFSAPRTPQQNGVVERKNRTLIEAARTMLEESKLPTYFWAEAINTACYTQNIFNSKSSTWKNTLSVDEEQEANNQFSSCLWMQMFCTQKPG